MSTIGSTALVSSSLPLPESAGSIQPSTRADGDQSAAKVAQDFESVFASMLLKEMRQSLEPGSLFGEDSGDIYGGLFDKYFGDQMTKANGLGLSNMMQQALEKSMNSGGANAAPPSSAVTSITG